MASLMNSIYALFGIVIAEKLSKLFFRKTLRECSVIQRTFIIIISIIIDIGFLLLLIAILVPIFQRYF